MQTELDQRIDIGFVSSLQARMMPQLLADYRKTTGSQTRFACYEGTTVTLLEPVSYTHLDVYKRQVKNRISRARPRR